MADVLSTHTGQHRESEPLSLQAQKEPKATHKPTELPQNAERDLVSSQYPTFAHEGAYALAGSVVKHAVLPNAASLRHLDFEGAEVRLSALSLIAAAFGPGVQAARVIVGHVQLNPEALTLPGLHDC